jgi:hypothetical protein
MIITRQQNNFNSVLLLSMLSVLNETLELEFLLDGILSFYEIFNENSYINQRYIFWIH